MCRMVWIGTERPLDPFRVEPGLLAGCSAVEPITDASRDAAVRRHFGSAYVAYVGAHTGCGCGFNSELLAFEGLETRDEALAFADAMTGKEREEFAAEDRSRAGLRTLVETALGWGPVELHMCWAGDEEVQPETTRAIEPSWLTEQLVPFEERLHYRLELPR